VRRRQLGRDSEPARAPLTRPSAMRSRSRSNFNGAISRRTWERPATGLGPADRPP
jgi:hypothetical protein